MYPKDLDQYLKRPWEDFERNQQNRFSEVIELIKSAPAGEHEGDFLGVLNPHIGYRMKMLFEEKSPGYGAVHLLH